MKILITGGCGFVGSNIAIFLNKKLKKAKIFSLDNLTRKGSRVNLFRLKRNKIKNFNIDIENNHKINSLPKFDFIIDCCAEPAIEASVKDPERVFNTNLIGTFNLLRKCKRDKSQIIFLSSSRVYSINTLRRLVKNLNLIKPLKIKKKIDESFKTDSPSSLYGFTKFASENLIKEFFYKERLKYIINRFGVIAGPWQFGKEDQGFVTLWVAKHFFQRKLNYIGFGGRGNQVRDVIHIDDVCEIIFKQIKKIKVVNNSTFNIGGGVKNSVSLKELTLKCQKITGKKIKIGEVSKTSSYDVPYYVSDNSKVFKFYKWSPKKTVDQILSDIYQWLVENKSTWSLFK